MTAEPDLLPLPCPEPFAWRTDDYETDRSATTYDHEVKRRWIAKGWPVWPLYSYGQVRENIHAATAARDAEVEALRAEVTQLKDVRSNLSVQCMAHESRAERLEEALKRLNSATRRYMEERPVSDAEWESGEPSVLSIVDAALEQEAGRE